MTIRTDNLTGPEVASLLEEHLKDMRAVSPPASVHALDLEGLRKPELTFWTLWDGDALAGCAALKELTPQHGELKSMRTAAAFRRRGVAARLLTHVLDEASERGYTRLSLETGSQPFFAPAHQLYTHFGFTLCGPFASYKDDPNSTFMTRTLAARSDGMVRLTRFSTTDAAVLCAGDHDPEHRLRFDFPADFVPSLAHAEAVLARWEQERLSGVRFPFAVRDAHSSTLLGGCELQPLEGDSQKRTANLSYWTYPEHRGKGVATRAVALACQLAFETYSYQQLELLTAPDNTASRRVALRSGFQEIGLRDGEVLHTRTKERGG